ncbi:MAG: hypothetical protein DRI01_09405 [Chloroflexi bacterium]|nr:MAG: hypothetical protein DRI01_09405 [Chloroflexota bacterium]
MTKLCDLVVKFKVRDVMMDAKIGQKFTFDNLPDYAAEAVAEAWEWVEPDEIEIEVVDVRSE